MTVTVPATKAPREGYQLIPMEKGYGPLAGKYVPDAIHRDVMQLATRRGKFDRFWRQGVG